MRKLFFPFFCCLLLCGCAADDTAARVEAVLQNAAAASGYAALAEVQLDCGDSVERYTLSVKAEGDETHVSVLAPEALAGVTAVLGGETLAIEYEGLTLGGVSLAADVCAANCVPLALRAAARGEVSEQSVENGVLRLALLTESELRAVLYFDESNIPVFAELEENGRIAAQIEFTSFTFGVIIGDSGA